MPSSEMDTTTEYPDANSLASFNNEEDADTIAFSSTNGVQRVRGDFELSLISNRYCFTDTILDLIYKCCEQAEHFSDQDVKQRLSTETAELFVDLAKMALTSASNELMNLSRLVSRLLPSHYIKDPEMIRIPSTAIEIQSQILSKRILSWRSLLPIPEVEKLEGGHSYSPLSGLVGYATMTSTEKDYQSVRPRHAAWLGSQRFLEFQRKIQAELTLAPKVIVIFFIWSDGFDPNLSSKGNRGNVWATTVTFLFYDCNKKQIYMVRTLLAAIGKDKTSHKSVWRKIRGELLGPTKVSYPSHFHKLPGDIDFHLICFGCLMDNPERRSNFSLRGGNSKMHTLFSLNCRFDLLETPFESLDCQTCQEATATYISNGDFTMPFQPIWCQNCLSFSIARLVEEGKYSRSVLDSNSDLLPIITGNGASLIPGHNLAIRPGFLDCGLLRDGWNHALHCCLSGNWTINCAKDYLVNILCLNDEAVGGFSLDVDQLRKYSHYQSVQSGEIEEEDAQLDVLEEVRSNIAEDSSLYDTCGKTNPIWDCFELKYAYETVMHNALNVGKAVRELTFTTWASQLKLKKQLVVHVNERLSSVQLLRIEDFKARGINSETFGGYVGENYRAFLTLLPWVFLCIKEPQFHAKVPGRPARTGIPIDGFTLANLKHYFHISNVRTLDVQEIGEGILKTTSKPITWLQNKSQYLTLAKQIGNATEAQRGGSDPMEFIVLPSSGRSGNFKARPNISHRDILHGSQVYDLLPAITQFFAVLMDTSHVGLKSRHRAEAHAISLLGKYVQVLSKVTDRPAFCLRQKSCLLGILRSTFHLGNGNTEDLGNIIHCQGDVPWLKSIHEGDDMGEGIVKHLRKLVPNGLRGSSWQVPVMRKYYKGEAMDFVESIFGPKGDLSTELAESVAADLPQLQDEEAQTELNFGSVFAMNHAKATLASVMYHTRKFRRYPSHENFKEDLVEKRNCLSLLMFSNVITQDVTFGYVTAFKQEWNLTFLVIGKEDATYDGMWYFDIDHSEAPTSHLIVNKQSMNVNGHTFLQFCIALPHNCSSQYTFVMGNGANVTLQDMTESQL